MEERKTRTGRDEWRKRIERWRENGLSAEAFATEFGTKPATLKFLELLPWAASSGQYGGGRSKLPSLSKFANSKRFKDCG